jgi:hypothetical protein
MQRQPALCQFPARREHGLKYTGLVWKVRCSHTTEGPSGAAGGVGLSRRGGNRKIALSQSGSRNGDEGRLEHGKQRMREEQHAVPDGAHGRATVEGQTQPNLGTALARFSADVTIGAKRVANQSAVFVNMRGGPRAR